MKNKIKHISKYLKKVTDYFLYFYKEKISKLIKFEKYHKFYFFLTLISLFLIYLILFSFYYSVSLGGDDTKTYLFYPEEFLNNYSSRFLVNSENTLFLISLLMKVGFNIYFIYFFIVLISTVFCYFLVTEITHLIKKTYSSLDKFFALFLSVLYSFSISSVSIGWANHWISILIYPLIPLTFLIIIKIFFKKMNVLEIIVLNLILSSLSISTENTSHLLVILIAFALFFILNILLFKETFFVSLTNIFKFSSFFIILNANWLVDFVNRWFTHFRDRNPDLIPATELSWALNFKFLHHSKTYFLENLTLSAGVFNNNSWVIFLIIIVLVILIIITFLVFSIPLFLKKKKDVEEIFLSKIIAVFTIFYALSLYLHTLGSTIAYKFFVYLSEKFDFLLGLRNYDNKTVQVYSIAVILMLTLTYCFKVRYNRLKNLIIFVFIIINICYSSNILFIRNSRELVGEYKEFSPEFKELITYMRNGIPDSRFYFLPITGIGWTYFLNQENNWYKGVLPIYFLVGNRSESGYFPINSSFKIDSKEDIEKYINNIKITGNEFIVYDKKTIDNDLYKKGDMITFLTSINYDIVEKFLNQNYKKIYETSNSHFLVYDLNNKLLNPDGILYIEDKKIMEKEDTFQNYISNKAITYEEKVQKESTYNFKLKNTKELPRDLLYSTKFKKNNLNFTHFNNNTYLIKLDNFNNNLVKIVYPSNYKLSIDYVYEILDNECLLSMKIKTARCFKESNETKMIQDTINDNKIFIKELDDYPLNLAVIIRNKDTGNSIDFSKITIESFRTLDNPMYEKIFYPNKYQTVELTNIEKIPYYKNLNNFNYSFKLENNLPFIFATTNFQNNEFVVKENELINKIIEFKDIYNQDYFIVYPKDNVTDLTINLINPRNELYKNLDIFVIFSRIFTILLMIILIYKKISK